MKLLLILVSFSVVSIVNAATLSKRKINGPECVAHLMEKLELKAEDAYQICSAKSEDIKICLIKNNKLSKKELVQKCHQK